MKISIITATYNSASTLRDTMRSVLAQGYTDWEHIIVDGKSKDETVAIIREMEPQYGGRLRWVSETDRGLYDAMNKGISMATGDVVGILNSDDFYTSDSVLEKVATALSDPKLDAVYGDIHFVDSNDLSKCVRYYSSRYFSRWQMLMGYLPAHPSYYCRKKVYDMYGLFDLSMHIAADFEQLFRVIYIHRIATRYLPLDFVTMRTGGASTSGIKSHLRIIADHIYTYTKHGIHCGYVTDFLRYPCKVFEHAAYRVIKLMG